MGRAPFITVRATGARVGNRRLFDHSFMRQVGEIAIEEQILHIVRGARYDGTPQKQNAPTTTRRKVLAGRPALPVVDAVKRFINRATYLVTVRSASALARTEGQQVWITTVRIANAEARRILGYLEDKGYTHIMGFTETARGRVGALVRARLQELIAAPRLEQRARTLLARGQRG